MSNFEWASWAETLDENEGALALLRTTLHREADVLRRSYSQRTLDENEGALVLLRATPHREADVLRRSYSQRLVEAVLKAKAKRLSDHLLVEAVLKANAKRLSDHLVLLLDKAEPEMWGSIRTAHSESVRVSVGAIEAGLKDVGLWEEKGMQVEVRDRFDTLVNDKVGDKAAEGSMADRLFQKFDMHYNRGHARVRRLPT
ncbi:hypothetical protein T484DRAFT_1803049 [Baffinella frigidus]|nr:hypothetical protein T484DRAFT_1803049 [Cryptophyta sp. CCMP2293]